jgi:hypothetical protein
MGSQTKIILEAFNNTFKEFLKELCTVFPGNENIKKYKNGFNLLTTMTPKLTIQSWQAYVNEKYYDEIITMRNINNFIDKDYSSDIRNLGNGKKTEAIEFIDNIREPLRDLEESNKETSLNYVQNLCKLSAAYHNSE